MINQHMKLSLNSIAIIVSSEEGVNFYKSLGFEEVSREVRKESHDELICLFNGDISLRLYKDATHPTRNRKPESLGLRYLTFEVDDLSQFKGVEIKEDQLGRFIFLNDPDGQPVQIREKR